MAGFLLRTKHGAGACVHDRAADEPGCAELLAADGAELLVLDRSVFSGQA